MKPFIMQRYSKHWYGTLQEVH